MERRSSDGPIKCSMGVMAHNEAANISRLLEAVLSQRTKTVAIVEVIVVASGCTDRTEEIVTRWMGQDPRIRLVVQQRREGKASAVNRFLSEASEHLLLLIGADLLPAPDAIESLVSPFADPDVAMTASRPTPVNDPNSFMGFAAHLLWNLHHEVNLTDFKAGELIAFRKNFAQISDRTAVDEATIESLIRGKGGQVRYVGNAIAYNMGPDTVADFLRQRRRIYAGRLALRDAVGYRVATLSSMRVLGLALRHLDWHPRAFAWTWLVAGLEAYARLLGWCDYRRQRNHAIWEIATTTKQLQMPATSIRATSTQPGIK